MYAHNKSIVSNYYFQYKYIVLKALNIKWDQRNSQTVHVFTKQCKLILISSF